MVLIITGLILLGIGIYILVQGGIFVVAGYSLVPVGAILLLVGLMMRGGGKRNARLLATGVDATATIKEAHQTNVMVNNQPMVSLTLEITPPTATPFTATLKTVVPIMVLSQVKLLPGATLPVKLDPAKPTNFVIDWNGAIQQQAMAAQAPAGVSS